MDKKGRNFKKIIYLLLIFGLIGVLTYFLSGDRAGQNSQLVGQEKQSPASGTGQAEGDKQEVLDCAKKINQDELAMVNSQDKSDNNCIFTGCSNFFE